MIVHDRPHPPEYLKAWNGPGSHYDVLIEAQRGRIFEDSVVLYMRVLSASEFVSYPSGKRVAVFLNGPVEREKSKARQVVDAAIGGTSVDVHKAFDVEDGLYASRVCAVVAPTWNNNHAVPIDTKNDPDWQEEIRRRGRGFFYKTFFQPLVHDRDEVALRARVAVGEPGAAEVLLDYLVDKGLVPEWVAAEMLNERRDAAGVVTSELCPRCKQACYRRRCGATGTTRTLFDHELRLKLADCWYCKRSLQIKPHLVVNTGMGFKALHVPLHYAPIEGRPYLVNTLGGEMCTTCWGKAALSPPRDCR